jgi:hypothetical protein
MQVAQRRLGDLGFFCRRAAWSAPQARYVAPLAPSLLTPDGFCAQHFGLGTDDVAEELANRRQDPNSMAKLVHLELWGRTCTMGQDPDELGDRLASAIGKT